MPAGVYDCCDRDVLVLFSARPVPGFTPLPAPYFAFLAGSITSYLLLVEIPNRRRFGGAAVLAPQHRNFSR